MNHDFKEVPSTETPDDGDLTLALRQRAHGTLTQQVFGLEPYIIIRPTFAEDTGGFQVGIETGGGADLVNVGEFLELIAEAMQADATKENIAAATSGDDPDEDE
ncbi:hypothetical protein SEA_PEGGYLEG03_48 [Arthrobacter phage PeggyLeg03]|nr:hypothetical protein SEA_PEGGYLEG03_48 [Arthrobacter phage PeggyLeg03]